MELLTKYTKAISYGIIEKSTKGWPECNSKSTWWTIEDLMPQDHFLRKLEKALDLSFVYEETRHLYSQKYGRPPIDPVVLVKYLLVGFLYGIPSERQIEKRIETDIALRWYLGLDLLDRVPDHSTISQVTQKKAGISERFPALIPCCRSTMYSGRAGNWQDCSDRFNPHEGKRFSILGMFGRRSGRT